MVVPSQAMSRLINGDRYFYVVQRGAVKSVANHDGSASGPIIPGAQVSANDESGNSFTETTNAKGFVTITGKPGSWSLTASADGYVDNPWKEELITSTCTRNAYLQKEETQQPSATTSSQQVNQPTLVTLTLYVHEENRNGPVIPGVQVTIKEIFSHLRFNPWCIPHS